MKIEIFPSLSGDCLLVTSSNGKTLLADGGLPEAYEAFVAEPLSRLNKIDLAYVSHIDRDHIGGILRMLDHKVQWKAYRHSASVGGRRKQPAFPEPPPIDEIWHNAFLEEIGATQQVDLGAALAASANVLAGLDAAGLANAEQREIVSATQMLALSVGDAIEVNWRIGPDQLGIPLNTPAGGKLMTARLNQTVALGTLNIRVLAPTAKYLEELRDEWIAWLKKSKDYLAKLRRAHDKDASRLGPGASAGDVSMIVRDIALAAAESDVTPPNLASLVLLVEEGNKRLLLTGDAGDQSLLDDLKAAGLLDADGMMEVDVLKVPHHGADNSFSPEFVHQVRAQHYIFCGDGEHHNPEPTVVKGYLEEVRKRPLSGGRTTTFWFNWSGARATVHKPLWDEVEAMFKPGKIPANTVCKMLGARGKQLTLTI